MERSTISQKFVSCFVIFGVLSLFSLSLTSPVAGQGEKGKKGKTSSEEASEEASEQSSDSVPAIKVGQASISKDEFQERVDRRVQRRKMRQKMMKQKMKGKNAPKMPEIDRGRIKEQVKEQTIKQLVLEHHAENSDVTVKDSEVEKEWQNMVDRFGSEEKLTKRLEQTGKNKSDLMKDLRKYLKIKKFIDERTEKTEVSDQDVRDFYDKNKKRMGNKSFEKTKEQIRKMLEQKKLREARSGLVEDLRKKTDVDVNL